MLPVLFLILCVGASFDSPVITWTNFQLFSPTCGPFASILCPYTEKIFFPFFALSLEVNSSLSPCEDFLHEAFVDVTISSFPQHHFDITWTTKLSAALASPTLPQILPKVENYPWPRKPQRLRIGLKSCLCLLDPSLNPWKLTVLTAGRKGSQGLYPAFICKWLIKD